jgi:transposase
MVCRTHQLNKATGITYVYESASYWDTAKKQARNKKVCIGKLDKDSGEFIPSKRLNPAQAAARDPQVTAKAQIIGPNIILDTITQELKLDKLLQKCSPEYYQQIKAMAYYLVHQGDALSHCETWCDSHVPDIAATLTSQNISDILDKISVDTKQTFMARWLEQNSEDDHLCYDITSISSYCDSNPYIRHGYNRDGEQLAQLNLAVVFGQNSGLPLYFQEVPGSINDVKTLNNLLKTIKALSSKPLSYVMDKGFYSKNNVDNLFATKSKFIISVPLNNKWLQSAIDDVYTCVDDINGYQRIDQDVVYVHTRLYPWGDKRQRCYLHLYYNAITRANAVNKFNAALLTYKEELESGNTITAHQEAYDEFFIIKATPKLGKTISYNNHTINQYVKRYAGFYAILTNSVKDPLKSLQIYRDKDAVEKCFDDLKNHIDMKRLRMHTSKTVHGRLFVQFIALIYMSAIRKKLRDTKLVKQFTVRELLREMDTITKITYTGKYRGIITELTKSQNKILDALKIATPKT